MGADHHAIGDGEDVAHIVDGDAGVGEDGDVLDGARVKRFMDVMAKLR
jgi:hypothetical protein